MTRVEDGPAATRPTLLVLTSTYPRWAGDHEPGFVHELCRRLAVAFDIVVVAPSAPGAARHERMDGVEVHRFRYAPASAETLVNDGGIVGNLRLQPWKALLLPAFLASYARAARRAASGADLVHAHWLPSAIAAAWTRRPFVLQLWGTDVTLAKRMRWAARRLLRERE